MRYCQLRPSRQTYRMHRTDNTAPSTIILVRGEIVQWCQLRLPDKLPPGDVEGGMDLERSWQLEAQHSSVDHPIHLELTHKPVRQLP